MSGSGTPKSTTSTTTSTPPPNVVPFQNEFLGRASALSQQPFQAYGGQRIAPLTWEQEHGLNLTTQRALAGSPVLNAAKQNLTDTLSGAYLDPTKNPAFAPAIRRLTDEYGRGTQATTNAAFARQGAFGGSAHDEITGRNQANFAEGLNRVAGDIYNQERGRQMQANLFAPQAAESDYNDIQRLLGAGDVRREYGQDLLNAQYEEFLRAQQHPQEQLGILGNAVAGSLGAGGTTISSQPNPYRPSRSAGALGGAATGAALGSMIPGLGTGLGAGAGLLLGLLG